MTYWAAVFAGVLEPDEPLPDAAGVPLSFFGSLFVSLLVSAFVSFDSLLSLLSPLSLLPDSPDEADASSFAGAFFGDDE